LAYDITHDDTDGNQRFF